MTDPRTGIARAPTRREISFDRLFRGATMALGFFVFVLLALILVEIGAKALPAVRTLGLDFLTTKEWDVGRGRFGILAHIWGTLLSSLLGLLFGTLFGLAIAVTISQRFLPRRLEFLLKNVVELLAAIPSVVYGLWGIYVVIPAIRPVVGWLHRSFSFVPLFGEPNFGPSMLPAALVLGIMVLPTITAVGRDAMVSVPPRLVEAAYGLGATRWECILGVVLPTSATGIFGAVVLAFGRALGETMALAMLLGNSNVISMSLFSPGNTLAALLANSFPEASGIEVGALMYAALVLLLITLAANILGSWILARANRRLKGLRT